MAAVLGVIEGFYGPPWSWKARHRVISFMGEAGFGLYVYAPKDDPLHRLQWRERHLPEELDRFEAVQRAAQRHGVLFSFGIHPIDARRGQASTLDVLSQKLALLQDRGIRSFTLLFDDVALPPTAGPREQATLARWHAALANGLLARLRRRAPVERFLLAPTDYHGIGRSPYLEALGGRLAPEIDVFWTGPQVCSTTIAARDLGAVTRALRRRPVLWDNYPVNDGDMRHDPHVRPIRGRAADLPAATNGIVANGALEAVAGTIALRTLAAWWTHPVGYDPEAAWLPALRATAGNQRDATAIRDLAMLARRSPLEPSARREPIPALPDPTVAGAGRVAARTAAAWRRTADRLDVLDNRDLRRELAPWARKLRRWSGAIDAAVSLLGTRDTDRSELRRSTLARLEAARRDPYRVADDQVDQFIRKCLWLHGEPHGLEESA